MKKILFLVGVFLVAFLLVGCKGSVEDSKSSEDVGEKTDVAGAKEGGENADTAETEKTDSPKESVGEETYEEFYSLLQKNPEYKIKYDVTSNIGTQTVTIYIKDGNRRLDLKDKYQAWIQGEKVIVKAEGNCIDLSQLDTAGYNPEEMFKTTSVSEEEVKSEDEYIKVSSAGTKRIAGKSADCYEFVYQEGEFNQLTTYCLTQEGLPVYTKTINRETDEVITEVEAKSVENSVSDQEVEPCEPNIDMSNINDYMQ